MKNKVLENSSNIQNTESPPQIYVSSTIDQHSCLQGAAGLQGCSFLESSLLLVGLFCDAAAFESPTLSK